MHTPISHTMDGSGYVAATVCVTFLVFGCVQQKRRNKVKDADGETLAAELARVQEALNGKTKALQTFREASKTREDWLVMQVKTLTAASREMTTAG